MVQRYLTEGRNREVRVVFGKRLVQVSRPIPRTLWRHSSASNAAGGWTELDLAQTNYLRELVELPPETSSKVAVEKTVVV